MNTKEQLLQVAREQIQHKGYSGFSYADLAEAVGIRKASIHHHFPTKAILGQEVAIKYRQDFIAALRSIEAGKKSNIKKLEAYIQLFRHALEEDHKVCLGVMLAANHEVLPEVIKQEVRRFFRENEEWLMLLLMKGKEEGDFEFMSEPSDIAKSILSSLEGAMVIAESMGDPGRVAAISEWIISTVKK